MLMHVWSSSAQVVVQVPLEHTCPAPQRVPQAPQWLRSVLVSTQISPAVPPSSLCPGQAVCMPGQSVRHMPATQRWVSPHRTPQAPQLAGSTWSNTQVAPQSRC